MPINVFTNPDRLEVFGPSRLDITTAAPSGLINSDGSGNFAISGSLTAVSGIVSSAPISGGVSSSIATLAASGTISTSDRVSRVTTAATAGLTAMILGTGTANGQQCTVLNVGAQHMTMAASGTSNVANGTSAVITALTSKQFTWSSAATLWFGENP